MGRKPKNLKRTAAQADLEVPALTGLNPPPFASAPSAASPSQPHPATPTSNLSIPPFQPSIAQHTLHHQKSWHFESHSRAPAKSSDFNLEELPPLGTVQPTLADIVSPVFWDSRSSSNTSTLASCPGTATSRSSSLPLENPCFPPEMGPSDVLMKL